MRTEKHPYSRVIHYGTGGIITQDRAEFSTLCHRKFKQGHDAIMMSGYYGAQRVTCKDCRQVLNAQEQYQKAREQMERWIREGKSLKIVQKVLKSKR